MAMPLQMTLHKTGDCLAIDLEGVLTVRHAQDMASQLNEALDGATSVRVNTAAVQDIDTSILQILCSLRKTVPALWFEEPSVGFTSAVDRCGLRRELLTGAREGA